MDEAQPSAPGREPAGAPAGLRTTRDGGGPERVPDRQVFALGRHMLDCAGLEFPRPRGRAREELAAELEAMSVSAAARRIRAAGPGLGWLARSMPARDRVRLLDDLGTDGRTVLAARHAVERPSKLSARLAARLAAQLGGPAPESVLRAVGAGWAAWLAGSGRGQFDGPSGELSVRDGRFGGPEDVERALERLLALEWCSRPEELLATRLAVAGLPPVPDGLAGRVASASGVDSRTAGLWCAASRGRADFDAFQRSAADKEDPDRWRAVDGALFAAWGDVAEKTATQS
ncbi:MAG: hypothetical protein LBR32_09405 [Propionibacteriaceae bacterium]|jgi:hypothetical protein|nr:hypothetical protein [Propionibacteriaceae bacterium]